MTEYDESGYYEVQLNNKQLVFFFMAAVAIAVVVFLCGVMVGRGVREATVNAAQNNITESPSRRVQSAPGVPAVGSDESGLDYVERLESDTVEDRLKPSGSSVSAPRAAPAASSAANVVDNTQDEKSRVAVTKTAKQASNGSNQNVKPLPKSAASKPSRVGADEGAFTIQVVALKTQSAAQSLIERLQTKNYRAYADDGGGLHRVRVGRFRTRQEAETIAQKLRVEEKFQPYITQE